MTQKELARRVGISRAFVTLIESGKRLPSLEVVGRIMDECSAAIGTKRAAESWWKAVGAPAPAGAEPAGKPEEPVDGTDGKTEEQHEEPARPAKDVLGQVAPSE